MRTQCVEACAHLGWSVVKFDSTIENYVCQQRTLSVQYKTIY
jgi:hypothetical protein